MVSIVTATIGRESLSRVIDSVTKQTYQDYEHVIVFDGSSPITVQTSEKRNIISIEKSKSDHGKTPQNIGIVASRGEFVTIFDDDNDWLPEHLSCMMKPFEIDPTLQVVLCPLTMIHFNNGNFREERHFSLSQGKVDAGNWVARREVFHRNGLFWASHRRSYDWEFLKKTLIENKEKFTVIDQRTFLYYTPKP